MAISFNPTTQIISLDSFSVSASEIWSRWVDWMVLSDNAKYLPAFSQLGGVAPVALYLYLENGWRVKPQEASGQTTITGNLLVQGGGNPLVATTGSFASQVVLEAPVAAQAIEVEAITGGTVTQGDIDAITAQVWTEPTRSLTTAAGVTEQNISDIAHAVWIETTRTLTEAAGVTAQDILDISAQVWNEATRSLTVAAGVTAQDIADISDAVWSETIRNLTVQTGVTNQNVIDIAASVWSETTRGLTEDVNLITADILEISSTVWAESNRELTVQTGMTIDQDALLVAVADQTEEIHGQIQREVWINEDSNQNGNGYQQTPFDNWVSGIVYAQQNNLNSMVITGSSTIDRSLKDYSIRGLANPVIDFNGKNIDGTTFERCTLIGSYSGSIQVTECALINITNLAGVFITCSFAGVNTVASGADLIIGRVAPAIAGQPWTLNMNSGQPSVVAIHNSSGGVIITNMDHSGDVLHFLSSQGAITIDSSCTAGSIVIAGNAKVIDNSNGTDVQISATNSEILLDSVT